jgi:hypothetical protein
MAYGLGPKVPKEQIYWHGDLGQTDNFGKPYKDVMYDARTNRGPWANMSEASWRVHGCGFLGTGNGQKYKKQEDGRWLKVEG